LEFVARFNDLQSKAHPICDCQPLKIVNTTRPNKRRSKRSEEVFRGFNKLTCFEVEWLKQDIRDAVEGAKELRAQQTRASVSAEDEYKSGQQLMDENQFVSHFGVATAVTLTVKAAIEGDKWSGFFLGEMIPFLARQKPELMRNEHFARRVSEMGSAQKPRIKGPTLRTEIEEIIREVRLQRHLCDVAKHDLFLPRARKDVRNLERRAKLLKKEGFNFNTKWLDNLRDKLSRVKAAAAAAEALKKLSDFGPLSADQWFEQVVWPELRRREPKLRANPLIGGLKKANKSGKFQLSDLKIQARTTVMRIAGLPRPFYFS
jgi:hypothetical protein